MKKIILLNFCILFCMCNDKKQIERLSVASSKEYYDDYDNNEKIKLLTGSVLMKRDTIAYNTLERILMGSNHQRELLFYSLRMAEDSESSRACFTTFLILSSDNEENVQANKLATYYLLKAYEKGNISAKYEMNGRFENNKIPTSLEYWCSIRQK